MKKNITIILLLNLLITGLLFAQNNALDFDGSDDYVEVPSSSTLNFGTGDFTVSLWIKSSLSSNGMLVEKIWDSQSAQGGNGWAIQLQASGRFKFSIADTQNEDPVDFQSTDGTIWDDGKWHHLAIVVDRDADVTFYIDGKLDNAADVTSEPGSLSNDYPLLIGINYNKNATKDLPYAGQIDEVRLWNDLRTQTEIRDNMYKELAGTESNLVAYYKFNETTGTNANDSQSSSNNDGTLTNMTNDDWVPSPAFFGPKNCLDFDGGLKAGSPDYAGKTSSVSSKTDNFTMMAWIKPDVVTNGAGGWRCAVYNGDDGGGWGLGIEGTKVSGLFGGIVFHTTTAVLSTGNWYHITMRRSSGTVQFFLNGKMLDYSSSINGPSAPNAKFTIGNMYASDGTSLYTDSFDGQIDEVSVWDAALTGAQIRNAMCKSLVGDETSLVAYYNFDNTSGTTLQAFDGSTSNDLTLTNMSNDDWVTSTPFTTWLNTNSSDWSTASNWSDGSTPSSNNVGIYDYSGGTSPTLSGTPTVNNLVVGSTSDLSLSSNVTVNGNLFLYDDLDLNGNTVTLGSTAFLDEAGGNINGTSGTIQTTRALSNIDEDVAGLGAEITEDGNLGSTTIIRGHAAQGSQGIKRYYQINPTNPPSNATLVFNYLDAELNGLTESSLELFKSSDGNTWTEQSSSTINTTANTLSLTGINSFSWWTGAISGADASLPVELSSWTATSKSSVVNLQWSTDSEIENLGFIIERKLTTTRWEEIASFSSHESLKGQGSTTKAATYHFTDRAVQVGDTYTYRLSDVDFRGNITNHAQVSVVVRGADETVLIDQFILRPAFPNPFNPSTTIQYGLPEEANVTLVIYDVRGQVVQTLESGHRLAGWYDVIWNGMDDAGQHVSTGLYLTKLRAGSYTKTIKMLYLK